MVIWLPGGISSPPGRTGWTLSGVGRPPWSERLWRARHRSSWPDGGRVYRPAGSRLTGLSVGFDPGRVGLQLPGLHLPRLLHRPLDLGPHIRHRDHHQAGLPGVQVLAELLQVLAAHPGRRVTGPRPPAPRRPPPPPPAPPPPG